MSFISCCRNDNRVISLLENNKNSPLIFHFSKNLMFSSLRSLGSSANISCIWTKPEISLAKFLFIWKGFFNIFFFLLQGWGFLWWGWVGVSAGRNISATSPPRNICWYHTLKPDYHANSNAYTWEFSSLYFQATSLCRFTLLSVSFFKQV